MDEREREKVEGRDTLGGRKRKREGEGGRKEMRVCLR
jgi:hypothetical protein